MDDVEGVGGFHSRVLLWFRLERVAKFEEQLYVQMRELEYLRNTLIKLVVAMAVGANYKRNIAVPLAEGVNTFRTIVVALAVGAIGWGHDFIEQNTIRLDRGRKILDENISFARRRVLCENFSGRIGSGTTIV